MQKKLTKYLCKSTKLTYAHTETNLASGAHTETTSFLKVFFYLKKYVSCDYDSREFAEMYIFNRKTSFYVKLDKTGDEYTCYRHIWTF